MTTIHTLASGSSGNAALICCGGTRLLLDAGISCRRITAALRTLDVTPCDLSAVFITHTHSDHISGLATIVKSWDIPIFASEETARGLAGRIAGAGRLLHPCVCGRELQVDGVCVTPFRTSHDAPGSADFRFGDAGILTDTGYVMPEAREVLTGVRLLVLEANHDTDRLRAGPYPYFLKRRILGDEGHLSNGAAAEFAVTAAQAGAREIVLAHLSAENNTPELALGAVSAALAEAGLSPALTVAPRSVLSPCYSADAERSALC